jgi:hypothetical protein
VEAISLIVSVIALAVSGGVAWWTVFRPPTLVVLLPQISAVSIGPGDDQAGASVLLPILSLRNIGAKPVVIRALQLRFTASDGSQTTAFPESEMDFAKILRDSNTYESDGKPDIPVDFDKMFVGFTLLAGEEWSKRFAFRARLTSLSELAGLLEVTVEAKVAPSRNWVGLNTQTFDFGDELANQPRLDSGSYHQHVFRPQECDDSGR